MGEDNKTVLYSHRHILTNIMSSLISCYVNKVRENLKIKDANVGKKKKKRGVKNVQIITTK